MLGILVASAYYLLIEAAKSSVESLNIFAKPKQKFFMGEGKVITHVVVLGRILLFGRKRTIIASTFVFAFCRNATLNFVKLIGILHSLAQGWPTLFLNRLFYSSSIQIRYTNEIFQNID